MIQNSDDAVADRIYQAAGGGVSIQRLIDTCKLTEARAVPNHWRDTLISARDAVRMGACLADGTAAGPKWTAWLMDVLRGVHGAGDFGIRKALPEVAQPSIAIINGWAKADDKTWHVNCLAIGPTLGDGGAAGSARYRQRQRRSGQGRSDLPGRGGRPARQQGTGHLTGRPVQLAKNAGPSGGSGGTSPAAAARAANSRSPAT